MVGMIESWLMASAVDVRDIRLKDEALLGDLVDALDRSMAFYNMLGIDILRVRSVLDTEVPELDEEVKDEFLSRGFVESNGMLVKGNLVTECFERPDLLAVTMSLQNLAASSRLPSSAEALERYGSMRSNVETLIRVRSFTPMTELHKAGAVVRGYVVPERVGYCRPSTASLYRAALLRL